MNCSSLTDLLKFLAEYNVIAKKSLSQNFLIDANIVQKILKTAKVSANDSVLEIGPGPGHLTHAILQTGATIFAIEKDFTLANALQRFHSTKNPLQIFQADALDFPLETLAYQKVIANLPYHITTPLLEKLFKNPCKTLTLMVQKEVADRIFASANTENFGLLSLFVQSHAHLEHRFIVSANCFYPKPSVDSAVIHLTLRDKPLIEKKYLPILKEAFQKRRKCLSTSLKRFLPSPEIKILLRTLNIREDARPEMLSLEQWLIFLKNLFPVIVQINELTCTNSETSRQI